MKSTPDVPPALLEIVQDLREASADVDEVPDCAGGDYIIWMRKDRLLGIAKRLEEIAAELAKPWDR